MIIDSFDNKSDAIISPESFCGKRRHICDLAIATFSREIYRIVLEKYQHEEIDEIRASNRIKPLHLITADGMKIAFYLSEIGASLASTDIIDVNWKTGASHFIAFGSAGTLDKSKTKGKYVIPTEAYRDDGMSYHYAPPANYIRVKNSDYVASIFDEYRLPYVTGKVWTTDAIYRETINHVRQRKDEGCIAVEMEIAGMQAVCNFHGFQLYDFLVTGDVVEPSEYTTEGLSEANHSMDKFNAAILIAKKIIEAH